MQPGHGILRCFRADRTRREEIRGQHFADPVDGMIGNAPQHGSQISFRSNAIQLRRAQQTIDHRSPLTTSVRTSEEIILASEYHHASILPISGMKLRFTIVGTRFTVDDCRFSTANNVRAAGLSMSKWHPAL